MTRWVLCAMAGGAAVLALAQDLDADVQRGLAFQATGNYAQAEAEFQATTGPEAKRSRLELARLHFHRGAYGKATTLARSLFGDAGSAVSAQVLVARVLLATGKPREAIALLEPQMATHGSTFALRDALADSYKAVGRKRDATALYERFADDWSQGKVDTTNAEQLFFAARAFAEIGAFQDASATYRDAIDRNPKYHDANVAWGELFLSKYAPGDAAESFAEVLRVDPNHPGAHVGMAAVKVSDVEYNLVESEQHIAQALRHNPNHEGALLVRAQNHIDLARWKSARKVLHRVLQINPASLRGRGLLATVAWLNDEPGEFAAQRDAALKENPEFAEFFHIVARSAVREHRYTEAVELEKEALAIDANYFAAMQEVGTGYLRLGDEKEGLRWLQKAWDGDPYNQRTKNTLDLFETHIPNSYSFVENAVFRIRYHNDERPVLERLLEPMLNAARAEMENRYGFEPKRPITIELFKEKEHYSVRTVGLPNLGALGVCFGRVITAMSPSSGDINWAMVLYHELSHVFAIQLSNSRVPRWYTEGLSEYETVRARPEWRRENDADLWRARAAGKLPSVVDINDGFLKPTVQDVVVAYHLSSVVIEYIAQAHGFAPLVEGLRLFGQGKDTAQVITAITGKTVGEFDRGFSQYLDQRLRPYQGSLLIPAQPGDLKKLESASKAPSAAAADHARLALAHFFSGDGKQADLAATKALALAPEEPIALFVKAELAMRARKLPQAEALFARVIAGGHDNFDVRTRLAALALAKGDKALAIGHLCAAKALDPERSAPYRDLAALYFAHNEKDKALAELETFVTIEQMDSGAILKLTSEYAKQKRWGDVVYYGERAMEIEPFNHQLTLQLAEAYLHTNKAPKALFYFDTALLIVPSMRRPALAEIGRTRALLAMGQHNDAKAAISRALQFEPDNAEALALGQTLTPKK